VSGLLSQKDDATTSRKRKDGVGLHVRGVMMVLENLFDCVDG
jgi:hypothetical protein